MVQNNISQIGEGTENPDKELGGLEELPNRAKITTSFRDFKYRQGLSSREVRKEIQQVLKNKYPGVSIAVEKNLGDISLVSIFSLSQIFLINFN